MHQEKRTAPEKEAALKALRTEYRGNDAATQRRLIFAALQTVGPISTIEAREILDVLHPAGRIKELRDDGEPIQTHWADERTEVGERHRVGVYVLARKADQEGATP